MRGMQFIVLSIVIKLLIYVADGSVDHQIVLSTSGWVVTDCSVSHLQILIMN